MLAVLVVVVETCTTGFLEVTPGQVIPVVVGRGGEGGEPVESIQVSAWDKSKSKYNLVYSGDDGKDGEPSSFGPIIANPGKGAKSSGERYLAYGNPGVALRTNELKSHPWALSSYSGSRGDDPLYIQTTNSTQFQKGSAGGGAASGYASPGNIATVVTGIFVQKGGVGVGMFSDGADGGYGCVSLDRTEANHGSRGSGGGGGFSSNPRGATTSLSGGGKGGDGYVKVSW